RAVARAAAFTAALAEALAAEEPPRRGPADTKETPEMSQTISNVAKDNARAGVQAGHVQGGIRMAAGREGRVGRAAALAELAVRRRRAGTVGHPAEYTHRAAEPELTPARAALRSTGPQDVGAVTRGLRKVRGLVGDVAALSAGV